MRLFHLFMKMPVNDTLSLRARIPNSRRPCEGG